MASLACFRGPGSGAASCSAMINTEPVVRSYEGRQLYPSFSFGDHIVGPGQQMLKLPWLLRFAVQMKMGKP